jgi:hypothetical protein
MSGCVVFCHPDSSDSHPSTVQLGASLDVAPHADSDTRVISRRAARGRRKEQCGSGLRPAAPATRDQALMRKAVAREFFAQREPAAIASR